MAADHPVARSMIEDRVPTVRGTDRPDRSRVLHPTRELGVADRRPKWDLRQRAPHPALELRPVRRERHRERPQPALEVRGEPLPRLREQCIGPAAFLPPREVGWLSPGEPDPSGRGDDG